MLWRMPIYLLWLSAGIIADRWSLVFTSHTDHGCSIQFNFTIFEWPKWSVTAKSTKRRIQSTRCIYIYINNKGDEMTCCGRLFHTRDAASRNDRNDVGIIVWKIKFSVLGGRSTATVTMYCLPADYFRLRDRSPRKTWHQFDESLKSCNTRLANSVSTRSWHRQQVWDTPVWSHTQLWMSAWQIIRSKTRSQVKVTSEPVIWSKRQS